MRRFLGALVTLALLTSACATGAVDPEGGTGLTPCDATGVISVGEGIPACSFRGMEGFDDVDISELLGKPIVINFWASWCVFCVREMPDFQEVHEEVGDRVSIVGLNTLGLKGETEGAAETFRERTGARYLMAFDPDGAYYTRFQPNLTRPVMPLTILADADGTVVARKFGPYTLGQLRDTIAEHFGVTA